MLISKCHSDEASGLPEAHGPLMGPPKSMGPGVIVPSCPPLGGPVDKSRYFGCLYCANSVRIASLYVHCNLIAALMLRLTTLIDLTCCFFILKLTICPVVNFVFLHRHENSCFLFHPRFSLILFIFLVFKLIVILFGVRAWYFYYGKCSS